MTSMNKCKRKEWLVALKAIVPVLSIAYFLYASRLSVRVFDYFPGDMALVMNIGFRLGAALVAILLFYVGLSEVFPHIRESRFKKPSLPQFLIVVGMTVILFYVSNLLIYLTFRPEMMPLRNSHMSRKIHCYILVSSVLVAPIFEEVCFRLIPLSVFRSCIPRVVVMVVCGVVFGYIHHAADNQMFATVGGFYLGILFLKWRNPLLCMIAHSVVNLLSSFSSLLAYFSVEVYRSESFPAVSKIPSEITIVMMILGVAILTSGLYLQIRMKGVKKHGIAKRS